MTLDARTFVAGHGGLVGSGLMRLLQARGATSILTATRDQLDLRDQAAVNYWFRANRPEYVYLVAGTVGGIMANSTRPAEFIYDNMLIHATVVHARARVSREEAPLPRELVHLPARLRRSRWSRSDLLTGALEPTNEPYAIAKIAGIKLCEAYRKQYGDDFISAMPTNLYGPNDNFDLDQLPRAARTDAQVPRGEGLGREAGRRSGAAARPRRELLHVDDLAEACVFLMDHYDGAQHVNVGTGEDLSIRELAETVRDVVHPTAQLTFDTIEARRHAAQAPRRVEASRPRVAASNRPAKTASPRRTSGSWITRSSLRLSVAPAV